jgi:hypothetical protein
MAVINGKAACGGWLLVLGACAMLIACEDECEFDSGPWRPAREFEPCNAPPDVLVNASDNPAALYRCVDHHWRSDEKAYSTTLAGDPAMPICAPSCFADVDHETPTLDVLCNDQFVAERAEGGVVHTLQIPRCGAGANGWTIPAGETRCIGIAIGTGAGFDAVPQTCVENGINGAFIVVSNESPPLPDGYEITVSCQFDRYPQEPCPGAMLERDRCHG